MAPQSTPPSASARRRVVTHEALSVAPELEKSGALLPQNQVQIVFESGDERYSEEYTEMSLLEDLSPKELQEWLDAARRGKGV